MRWTPFKETVLRIAFIASIGFLLAAGCNSSAPAPAPKGNAPAAAELTKVKLGLNWYPEAEHGGFYAALVNGYYREAGLDVEIVKGGPSVPVLQQVAGGRLEFGVYNADGLLLARAEEAPVVALMAPLQISPRCIMVHKSSGIKDFADLKNMTIALGNSQPFYLYLRKKIPLEGVTIVPYQGSVAPFLADENFAQQAYVFSEPFVAEQQGGDPESLLVAKLGFNPYTSVLFTNEEYLREHAEIVDKLVKASVRGWEAYLAEPEAANQRIHELNPEMSLEALAFGVQALAPLVRDEEAEKQGIGGMSLERWRTLTEQLEELELLKPGAVDPEDAFSAKFLPKN
ncbi:MAG TPA: ABC transporter substrate-binding protein [Pirellulales bacterium]|nr:ABC transporter substrate-binding protein [Pirellulales bacterium]